MKFDILECAVLLGSRVRLVRYCMVVKKMCMYVSFELWCGNCCYFISQVCMPRIFDEDLG